MRSYYELHQPLSNLRLAHFWDYFSGDALHSRWAEGGTGTKAMNDAVNGGLSITTSSSTNSSGFIAFNDIRHYAHDGSVIIGLVQNIDTASYWHHFGLTEQIASVANTRAIYVQDSTNSFIELNTSLNASTTVVATSLSLDQALHSVKIELKPSSCIMHVDGALEAVGTANLPDVKLQPKFRQGTRTTASKQGNILYAEAYNV